MRSLEDLMALAAARKGGRDAIEALLPQVKTPARLARIPDDRWLSQLSKRLFQSGFAWRVVEAKWAGHEEAFGGFDVNACAFLNDDQIDDLARDRRIIRNRAKIEAVRANAAFFLELRRESGSVGKAIAAWPADDFVGLLAMLKRRGARLGGNPAQIWLRDMGRDGFILSPDMVAALIREGVVDRPPTSRKALAAIQAAFDAWCADSGRPMAQISRLLALTIDGPGYGGKPEEARSEMSPHPF